MTVGSVAGTSTGGTLPGGPGTRVEYDVQWSPPVFLDPPPAYNLVPNTTLAFPIPLATPTAVPGGEGLVDLPDSVEKFPIPLVGTPAPGQPNALPSAELAFAVPVVPTPTPEAGAADPLPAVTAAFPIPLAPTPVPEQGAPPDLPTLTEAFDVPVAATPTPEAGAATALDQSITEVFSIPVAPTPSAVPGVGELASTTEAFSIPNGKSPRGMATDGTDFYILVDGTPDQIFKVSATGTLDVSFDTDGIVDVSHNSLARSSAEAITYVSGSLYVSEDSWREDGTGGYSILKFDAATGAEVDITAGDNSCMIPNFDRFSGLHADGTRLWGVVDWGGKFVKITTDCTEVTSYNPWPYNAAHGLTVGSGDHPFFFVSEGETIVKRDKSDASDTGVSWTLSNLIIKGLTYDGGLLYIADADSKKVYKANIPHGQTITTDPRAMAYDGTYLYILVDAAPKDKIVVVDPNDASDPPAIVRSFDAPSSSGDALTYADGFLWLGQASGCCDREIKKIDPQAGNVAATLTLDNPIWNNLGGLGYDGTDLVGFTKNDRDFYTISKANGDAVQVESTGVQEGFQAGTYRTTNDRVYSAITNKVYEFTPTGELRQSITLAPSTTAVKGMTFIGPNLYFADDDTNKIYRGSIPHGITITTNPLALAANGTTTLYILVDGTPRDKILVVNPTNGTTTSSYDAPDDDGAGLTYLGASLYYASNKDSQRRIYELNPTTGAELSTTVPLDQWGNPMWDSLTGLGNDGTDLVLATNNPWDNCVEVIDPATGSNNGRLCADWQQGIIAPKGVTVAPDGFIVAAKDDEIVQLTPEGIENASWMGLVGATDIEGLAFVGGTLYIGDAASDKVYKTTVPSGIQVTTNPLGLAYGTANGTTTLFILVDSAPNDKLLLVDPNDGSLRSSYDAPDDDGGGLTYLGTSLYYASNRGDKRIYQLDPDSGTQLGNFFPQDQWGNNIWNNILALSNDGTDLLLAVQDPWDQCLKKVNSTNGASEGQFCPPWEDGLASATGLAVTGSGDVIEGKDGTFVQVTADESFAVTYQTSLSDLRGLTFVSSNLFVADDFDDTIYKTTVPSGVNITTDPRALAYRTAGTTTTMFILVDATPKDKILLVDLATSTGSLVDSYDAPDRYGQGLTYLGSSLYYAGRNQDGQAKYYELNPDTGAVITSIFPKWDWGGEIWDDPRSLANNGTDLLGAFGNDDCIQTIDKLTGDNLGSSCTQFFEDGLQGPTGLDIASDGSFFEAKSMDVAQLVTIDPDLIEVGRWSPTSTTDIEGLVFVGEVLYLADDGSNSVYKASKPSGITNDPRGMAYDGTNLYILVDGSRTDHILVVDPADGTVVNDFDAPDRESFAITHLGSSLFIGVTRFDQCCGPPHSIEKISATDGSFQDSFSVPPDFWSEELGGLTNDGTSLIATQNRDSFALYLDPTTGQYLARIDFYGGFFDGFDALAFHGGSDDIFAARASAIFRFDEDGRMIDDFTTTLNSIEGAVFVGNALFLAEAANNTIQAASIPAPPTVITTSPKGMATDGSIIYLAVDGYPKDRILVLDTAGGPLINSFEAPGDNTDALAWHNGDLYAATNEFHPNKGQIPPRIHRISTTTGAILEEYEIQSPFGGAVWEQIAGLASDGTYLYAGLRFDQGWYRFDPTAPGIPAERVDTFHPPKFRFMYSSESLEVAEAVPSEPRLLAGGFAEGLPVLSRFDKDTGEMLDQFEMGNVVINGMAYIGTVLYIADASSDSILTATLPDNIPEITTAGDYTAVLRVTLGAVTRDSSPALEFSLVRNTNLQTEITTPLDNFATTTDVIPIQGRVNDPSIDTVQVGVVLPFTNLLEDHVTQGGSPTLWDAEGLWHIDCSVVWDPPVNSSGPCAWRYGEVNQFGYGQGVVSQGSLTTKDPIAIGPNTTLRLRTWYSTEPVPDVDLKLVEVAVVTTEDGNDVIGDYQALIQIVGFGFFGAPVPTDDQGNPLFDVHSDFEHWEVEQEWVEFTGGSQPSPLFATIEKSLHPFIGDRTMLRFRFDTVDDFANEGAGWLIDDIEIQGSGFKGSDTPVIPLDPPLDDGTETWYGTFGTTFQLAEGSNQVVAHVEHPYPPKPHGPNLSAEDFVLGFLDLTGPEVFLGGIDDVVSGPSQTLSGTIDDINFTSMVITQTYLAGSATTTKTVYAITEMPVDGTFSAPVSLLEGTNTFEATAIDGSLNQSVVTFAVELDTVPPTLTALQTSYPVGATSARAGDLVVFQVDATDALGVQRVFVTLPDSNEEDMVPSNEIPEAVLDQWGVTGGWVLPLEVPPATPPGAFEIAVAVLDNAGNETSGAVLASVVPTLEGFTFNLLPGQNLISLPLTPDTSTIPDLLVGEPLSAVDTIMYYDASLTSLPQEDRWLMFSPDAPVDLNTLNDLQTGRGYWFRMKDEAFTFSAPLAPGLPQTPRPIVLSYSGQFLAPGTVPPSYPVEPGWNLIGFHSEHPLPVTTALQSLESPQRVWASVFQYDNVIQFDLDEEPVIILGGFSRVLPTGTLEPGKGFWIFMVDSGLIVP